MEREARRSEDLVTTAAPCCTRSPGRAVRARGRRQRSAEAAVELPHPRPNTMKTSAAFSDLKARLTEEIRVEALLVAQATG
jgi:hypothetical protein